jgi:hypothetical protein
LLLEILKRCPIKRGERFFFFAEECLEEGDSNVKDAIATCFLENLLNAVSDEIIKLESFVQYLGENSKEFCKSWDLLTGVNTPGL